MTDAVLKVALPLPLPRLFDYLPADGATPAARDIGRRVHVFFLIGFRNRLVVMLNWTWAYWTYQRAARIILGRDGPG